MPLSDAFWHVANFFAPAVLVGLFAALATKVVWRRELAGVSWRRLWAAASLACAAVSVGGLLAFEHDGKMITYVAMVLACAAALWWVGLRRAG